MKTAGLFLFVLCLFAACQAPPPPDTEPRNIEVLFLGHDSRHHDSESYVSLLAGALSTHGINITYTSDPASLNDEMLAGYDALLLYANHDSITASQEEALLDFVESGKGFLPIHAASYCFRNSEDYVTLVGGQFLEHGTGVFTADILEPEHPAMDSLEPFETWDETYIHAQHGEDRTVLMERVEDGHHEPWTWVRTHGAGRMFYTAYGHDERTWSNPGFHALIRSGILWAVGDRVRALWEGVSHEPLRYTKHDSIPNYEERDPPPMLQQPLAPEASMRYIQVPVGFTLELFAAEPEIVNPIAMAWDERGRLFVLQTVDYPNEERLEGEGRDVIIIVEDTDGDGKADSFTEFADGLSIPTSIAFARGGVLVSQAPDILLLKDTDGDDRADTREVVLTGFGTMDTHAGPSNLKYGFDNWIWGMVGYNDFEGVFRGDTVSMGQGVYRFTPDGNWFEPVSDFTNNTWGLGFSETFDIFGSTANNEHSVFVAIPNRYYANVPGLLGDGKIKLDGHYAMHPITPNYRQVDVWGGFTASAGHNLYTARDYPRAYWNRIALVNEPTGNLLHNAILERTGSGYREENGWNLLASADEWVSPVHAEVGPDGAVWILDWYNFIVQHNPTPGGFRTGKGNAHINSLRDKEHGRIYRLAYKGARPRPMPTLDPARPISLINGLKHDNMFWRLTAQRLLVEGGIDEVLDDLYDLIRPHMVDPIGLNGPAVHALWTLHGLGVLDGSNEEALRVVRRALTHVVAGVRKTAAQVLPRTEESLTAILEAGLFEDEDLNVRLYAFLAASEMPPSDVAGAALYAQSVREDVLEDVWLPEALFIAASRHRDGFLGAFSADIGATEYAQQIARLAGGLGADGTDWSGLDLDTSDWGTMAQPYPWDKSEEFATFDGVVWFRVEIDVPAQVAGRAATIGLGSVWDSDVTYLNGVLVGEWPNGYGRPRVYEVPAGVLRAGRNVVAVRAEDTSGRGGFWGEEEQLFIRAGSFMASLATDWQYKVEEEYVNGKKSEISRRTPLALQFLHHHYSIMSPASGDADASGTAVEEAVEVALSVIPGALQFDRTSFAVPSGERIRLTFTNPDDLPHNAVFVEPGSANAVGAMLDGLIKRNEAEALQYVPDTTAVLFSTGLVQSKDSATLTFVSPHKAGDYPYLCTFPGHWRVMQGTMGVTAP